MLQQCEPELARLVNRSEAPVVNVEAPDITVEPPDVKVDVKAPNVLVAPEIEVNA